MKPAAWLRRLAAAAGGIVDQRRTVQRTASSPVRAERAIAAVRVGVAIATVAGAHEAAGAFRVAAGEVPLLFDAYAVFAVVVAVALLRVRQLPGFAGLVAHAVDLAAMALVLTAMDDLSGVSPRLHLLFVVAAAATRWSWSAAVWTGSGVLLMLGIGIASLGILGQGVESEFWIVSVLSLIGTILVVVMLAWRESRQLRERVSVEQLRTAATHDVQAVIERGVERTSAVLGASRVTLVCEDPDEPYVVICDFVDGQAKWTLEAPAALSPFVAEPLSGSDFVCLRREGRAPHVQRLVAGRLEPWEGAALNAALDARLALGDVLATALTAPDVAGYLLTSVRPGFTTDEAAAARLIGDELATSIDAAYHARRATDRATLGERTRLSRELHDGVMQSLTAAALQLRAADALATAGAPVSPPLRQAQQLLLDAQRELRFFIEEQKPHFHGLFAAEETLEDRLHGLARRVADVWSLSVDVHIASRLTDLSERVANGVYRLAQEALTNSARHGNATRASLTVSVDAGAVRLVLADAGRGFSFRGRMEHEELMRDRIGPVTLKARVVELDARLAIESSDSGARIEVTIPLSDRRSGPMRIPASDSH